MKKIIPFLLFTFLSLGAFSQTIVDYRAWQSPVKNQKNRGTCTAFAIIAAMETLPGMPCDLSEQYIFAQSKLYHYKDMPKYGSGSYLKFYIDRLTSDGTLREDQEPYQPDAEVWTAKESDFEKMKKDLGGSSIYSLLSFPAFAYKIQPGMYTYRDGDKAIDVDWIKKQLDEGKRCIPVSYGVNATYWFSHTGSETKQIDPNDFIIIKDDSATYTYKQAKKKFNTDDLMSLVGAGTIKAEYTDTIYKVNNGHAVAIVGYDANGFLIKNSWGTTDWGDKGYGWVSFDYHRLFAVEVLTLPLGKVAVNGWTEPKTEGKDKSVFRLKTLPYEGKSLLKNSTERGISVSVVYYGEEKMPRFSEIEYKGYDAAGKLLGTWYGTCNGIFDGRETGYETYIFLTDRTVFPKIDKMTASMKTQTGWSFVNTYRNLTAKNMEYKAE
jgi:hypothetical protein